MTCRHPSIFHEDPAYGRKCKAGKCASQIACRIRVEDAGNTRDEHVWDRHLAERVEECKVALWRGRGGTVLGKYCLV